jgi:hypothetical protein
MSVHVTSHVWKLRGLTPTEKLVMLAIADMSNHDGECWPGRACLAEMTELDSSTVRKTLRRLEAAGHLMTTPRPQENSPNLTNVYRILRPETGRPETPLGRPMRQGEGGPRPPEPPRRGRTVVDRENPPAANATGPETAKPRKSTRRQATPEQSRRVKDLTAHFVDQFPAEPVKTLIRLVGNQVRTLVLDGEEDRYIKAGIEALVKGGCAPVLLSQLTNNAKTGRAAPSRVSNGRAVLAVAPDWSDAKPGEFERFKAEGGDPMSPHCRQHFDFWRAVGRVPSWEESNRPDAWDRALAAARHGDRETGELASVFAASFGGVQ